MNVSASPRDNRFFPQLLAVLAVYVLLASIYAFHLQRNMDEFGTAVIVRAAGIPYRDYCPPKTLLAYYIVKPAQLFVSDAWNALTAARLLMVALTTAVLTFTAIRLRRWLSVPSILLALLLLVLMSNFAERQVEMRADGVSTLFALFALVALMSERTFLAGVLTALSFLSTQKGIYFVFSGEVATIAAVVYRRSKSEVFAWLRYNIGAAVTLFAYLAFFAVLSSPQRVMDCTFGRTNANVSIALHQVYSIRWPYWEQAIVRNPLFFALAVFGLVILALRWLRHESSPAEIFLTPFAFAITACSLWHKQPWPYFFVNLVPTLFVVNGFAIEHISERVRTTRTRAVLLVIFFVGAVLIPLLRLRSTLNQTSAFQEATFRAGQQLLGPNELYIDGVGFLYNRDEAVGILNWLELWRLEALAAMSPREQAALIAKVDTAPTKLIMWNYRMEALPPLMRNALQARFAPLYGNILLYAPTLRPGPFTLSFDGRYRVLSSAPEVAIDGTAIANRSSIELHKGPHVLSGAPARLQLLPPADMEVDAAFTQGADPFSGIYSY